MKLGVEEISCLNALRMVSRVEAKDVLVGEKTISFLVNRGSIGAAIGHDGQIIKRLESILKKRIEILEHQETPEKFVERAFAGIRFEKIETKEQNGKKIVTGKTDAESHRKLLGSLGKLKRVRELLKRNFEIDDVRLDR